MRLFSSLFSSATFAPKVYYFCYYAAMACFMPFLALYYRGVGLTGAQIGLLAGVAPVVTWLAAPLWGAVADATRQHRTYLLVATLGALVMVGLLSQARRMEWLLPVILGYAFFTAPIMPLIDNSVMVLLGKQSASYGRLRLWGAVGWGLSGAAAGILVERAGIGYMFAGYAFFMVLGLLAAMRLTIHPAAAGQPFWTGMRGLTTDRTLMVFLLTVLVGSMGSAVVHTYLFLYMSDLGAGETLMGLSLTVATLSEVPVFFFSALLLRKLGARGLLMVAMMAYLVRLAAYGVMPSVWWVLPINLLHGLTFAALWVAGVSYANEIAPLGMGATVQGLFAGIAMGLGAALGAPAAGALYDAFGGAMLYRLAAVWMAAGVLFFWVAGRRASSPVPS